MMANEKENFLSVLRCAVHHLPVQLTAPVDYKEILALAAEQNLQVLYARSCVKVKLFGNPHYLTRQSLRQSELLVDRRQELLLFLICIVL